MITKNKFGAGSPYVTALSTVERTKTGDMHMVAATMVNIMQKFSKRFDMVDNNQFRKEERCCLHFMASLPSLTIILN